MFYGWQKTSLIEYPGHIATVLFTGGCNFRCPYCQNPSLVSLHPSQTTLPEPDILQFLSDRKSLMDAVVITGGEPLLHPDGLLVFLKKVKALGYLIKVDTNASFSEEFTRLNRSSLIDRWGIDYKVPFRQYADLTTQPAGDFIRQTLEEALDTPHRLEIRTTLYPPFIDREILLEMARPLTRAPHWYWHPFRNQTTLSPEAQTVTPYPPATILSWKQEIDRKMGKDFIIIR